MIKTQAAPAPIIPAGKLIARMAERFGVDQEKLVATLKATAFRQKEGQSVSNEQMLMLMAVAAIR